MHVLSIELFRPDFNSLKRIIKNFWFSFKIHVFLGLHFFLIIILSCLTEPNVIYSSIP